MKYRKEHSMAGETLEAALARLVKERGAPKKIMQDVRKLFPKASKKQIIRAAFAQMIERAENDLETSRVLQDFAIGERNGSEQ